MFKSRIIIAGLFILCSFTLSSQSGAAMLMQPPPGGGGGFNPGYQAILDKATALGFSLPSSGQQIDQNILYDSLEIVGAIDTLKTFYCSNNDGSFNFSRINWVNPDSFLLMDSLGVGWNAGSWVFSASNFFYTDFNTINHNLSNDCAAFVFADTLNTGGVRSLLGSDNGADQFHFIDAFDPTLTRLGRRFGSQLNATTTLTTDLYKMSYKRYLDGSGLSKAMNDISETSETFGGTASADYDLPFYVGSCNNGGFHTTGFAGRLKFVAWGAALSDSTIDQIYTIINSYNSKY